MSISFYFIIALIALITVIIAIVVLRHRRNRRFQFFPQLPNGVWVESVDRSPKGDRAEISLKSGGDNLALHYVPRVIGAWRKASKKPSMIQMRVKFDRPEEVKSFITLTKSAIIAIAGRGGSFPYAFSTSIQRCGLRDSPAVLVSIYNVHKRELVNVF